MADTTGNFQDLVQLSGDTLYHLGEQFELGNSAASTLTFGMSNNSGSLAVLGAPTANQTLWFPTQSNGTLLEFINLSAGTTSNNLSAITFSNSNNVSFGLNGSTLTASVTVASTQGSINVSAGTTSNNLSAITFSNSNNVSFGLNGSTLTASVTVASTQGSINVSAGTTSNNLSAVTFSNSNNVSFGLNGSTVTGSYALNVSANGGTSNAISGITFANSNGVSFGLSTGAGVATLTASVASALTAINISAGTTSNNLTAVTFANSNGISFGLNASTVTAQNGGISSWSNGEPSTAISGGSRTLYFQPFLVPYCLTATNLLFLASITNGTTNSSGGVSVSAALYTLNVSTLSLASSASTSLTWTSGAAYSSNSGINYQQMSLNSWAITPGPYLFAWWFSALNGVTMSYYGPPEQPSIGSGMVAAMSTLMLKGYSQATTNALPTSFGMSNTASYIRTGVTAAQQPYIALQGT